MTDAVLWPVAGSFLAALGSAFLAAKLAGYRGKPGAGWFALTLDAQAVFCVVSGAALLVFEPTARLILEVTTWTALAVQVVAFLAFALSYSGRSHLVETAAFRTLYAFPAVVGGTMLIRPTLIWPEFGVESVMGLATVEYVFTPLGVTLVVVGLFLTALAAALLVDTAVSYSLYRAESLAIALSAIPPGLAEVVWLLGGGPFPQVNLVPVAFIPHLLADGYAVYATDIFEYNPTTRRIVDDTAIESLDSPVIVVNRDRRIIELNAAAADVFATAEPAALKTPLDDLVGEPIDLDASGRTTTVRVDGELRHFAITPSEHADPAGVSVGYSVVFQDITVQRQREQRLDVLNRVLRHNIRNDLNVVRGNLELAREAGPASTDGGREGRLATAERHAGKLLRLAEDARTIDALIDRGVVDRRPLPLRRLLADAVDDATADWGAAVGINVPATAVVETDPDLFVTVVTRLLSAIDDHVDGGVTIGLDGTDGDVHDLAVRAGGSFPAHEIIAVEAGSETPLNHTATLDLWMVRWGAEAIGCELAFDRDATATLRVPVGGADGEG